MKQTKIYNSSPKGNEKQTKMKTQTTTGVFVTGEGITTSNAFYSSTTATAIQTPGYTLTTTTLPQSFTSSGGTAGINNYGVSIAGNPVLTYNDFWRFNEQSDLLWKSFFDPSSIFRPIKEKAVTHPCDIQETDNGLTIEVAAVGLEQDEINIIVDSETLRIAYRKSDEETQKEKDEYRYLCRSIKKASFDIAWKISSKYDLTKLEASLEKGLLTLEIPFAKENKPKKIEIKSKKELLKG